VLPKAVTEVIIKINLWKETFKETKGVRGKMSKTMEERINKERIECSYECIKNLMEAMKMTAEQAMSILKISDEDKAVFSIDFSNYWKKE